MMMMMMVMRRTRTKDQEQDQNETNAIPIRDINVTEGGWSEFESISWGWYIRTFPSLCPPLYAWAIIYTQHSLLRLVYTLYSNGPQRQWTKIITTNGLLRENATNYGAGGLAQWGWGLWMGWEHEGAEDGSGRLEAGWPRFFKWSRVTCTSELCTEKK